MTEQAHAGLFITFEGGDGAGKTTQIQRVAQWFEQRGREVVVTFEPGATQLGAELRTLIQFGPEDVDARTEALLYAADRAYHVATVIRPALEAGKVVLGDRFTDSSVAYQGAARDLGTEEIKALSAWATADLRPDLTFLLDLPPEVGARRGSEAPDRIERESADFHEQVRHEYLHLAETESERIVVIDAIGTPQQVFSEIRGVLEERIYHHSSDRSIEDLEELGDTHNGQDGHNEGMGTPVSLAATLGGGPSQPDATQAGEQQATLWEDISQGSLL